MTNQNNNFAIGDIVQVDNQQVIDSFQRIYGISIDPNDRWVVFSVENFKFGDSLQCKRESDNERIQIWDWEVIRISK